MSPQELEAVLRSNAQMYLKLEGFVMSSLITVKVHFPLESVKIIELEELLEFVQQTRFAIQQELERFN